MFDLCFYQSGDRDEWPGWSCRMKTSPLRLKMTGRDWTRSCIIRYERRRTCVIPWCPLLSRLVDIERDVLWIFLSLLMSSVVLYVDILQSWRKARWRTLLLVHISDMFTDYGMFDGVLTRREYGTCNPPDILYLKVLGNVSLWAPGRTTALSLSQFCLTHTI